ncbi:MAG: Ig-like domain-containing protein, partial [Pleurocapsa sp.]
MAEDFVDLSSGENLLFQNSDGYSSLSQQGFSGSGNDSSQDPGSFIGINLGNAGSNGRLGSNIAKINLASDLDISWGRASGGPAQWNASGSLSPENFDAVIDHANSKDVKIYLYLEYRSDLDGGSIDDFDWYEVGRTYASYFGDRVAAYGIINEPDNILSSVETPEGIAAAVEQFADGVHSVNSNYVVTSPGVGGTPVSIETTDDYLKALAPLFNDGTLQALNLHSYQDSRPNPHYSSIDFSSQWAPSRNFIRAKNIGGITANVNFLAGEFNYRNWQGTDEQRGIGFLTTLWAQLSVVGNGGINSRVGIFSSPFNITTAEPNRQTSMAESFSFGNDGSYTWQPNEKGQILEETLALTQGMNFVYTDPLNKGLVILRGDNRKMWVWDNREDFSNLANASAVKITGIPSDATGLAIYRWDSTASEPHAIIELNGQTSISFETSEALSFGQTYMIVANSDNDGGNVGSIDPTEIDDTGNNPPVANDDAYTSEQNTELNVNIANGVLTNDVDLDDDTLTVTLTVDVSDGTLVFYDDGSFDYIPDSDFVGTDSFSYQVSDSSGNTDTADVTLDITAVTVENNPPVANDDTFNTATNNAIAISLQD